MAAACEWSDSAGLVMFGDGSDIESEGCWRGTSLLRATALAPAAPLFLDAPPAAAGFPPGDALEEVTDPRLLPGLGCPDPEAGPAEANLFCPAPEAGLAPDVGLALGAAPEDDAPR